MRAIKRNLGFILTVICITAISFTSQAQKINRVGSNAVNAGSWRVLGTVHAKHTADHDALNVPGPHDYYRRIKFKVTDSPLNMQRIVVCYDDGAPENINTRFNIPKGGESRVIDLKGGKRKLKSIEFWYDTQGFLNGKADVTVFAMK
ncbi:hypothetical protein [Flavobacterium sp. JAS]|uniref:hypothetical protein n=1 Tax=Flavobacterium sp. JAS TaxID=2897329 RepID=UPI001E333BFC|nr:hypothetical protein [Flavobacterium sp. JAS]MCD0472088.1 hypothetical protein [Flavobacterium sp. JAS]